MIVTNQIDLFLHHLNLNNYVKSVKIAPGANTISDHNLVVMDFRLTRILKVKREKVTGKIDIAQIEK